MVLLRHCRDLFYLGIALKRRQGKGPKESSWKELNGLTRWRDAVQVSMPGCHYSAEVKHHLWDQVRPMNQWTRLDCIVRFPNSIWNSIQVPPGECNLSRESIEYLARVRQKPIKSQWAGQDKIKSNDQHRICMGRGFTAIPKKRHSLYFRPMILLLRLLYEQRVLRWKNLVQTWSVIN